LGRASGWPDPQALNSAGKAGGPASRTWAGGEFEQRIQLTGAKQLTGQLKPGARRGRIFFAVSWVCVEGKRNGRARKEKKIEMKGIGGPGLHYTHPAP